MSVESGFLGVDAFEWGGLAWVLAASAFLIALGWRRQPPSVAWPALAEARAAGLLRFDSVEWGARILRAATCALLALVLAGPMALVATAPDPEAGLDLVLVVDTSASMKALDAGADGEVRTRLALARQVVSEFADRRLRAGDRVGLVVFGESAFTQCPLTSDGRLLGAALARVKAGVAGEATALGDALALAVKRVSRIPQGTDPTPGRIAVLLTDGRSNAGALPPDAAAELARHHGVRVYTVGIGSAQEPRADASGIRFERHRLDAETLGEIARTTGGRTFTARSPGDLEHVYREIDSLERPLRPAAPAPRRVPKPEPLLALAGLLLAVEIAGERVLRRRIP